MAIRVWEYHVAIAESHLKEGNPKVPLILTFVLYHGKDQWNSATSISDLFDDFELYVNASLKSAFLLNLNEKEMEELKKTRRLFYSADDDEVAGTRRLL